MEIGPDFAGNRQPALFYVVDWLPPDFGAVGQYALIAAQKLAASGRNVHLVGLTSGPASCQRIERLAIERLHARLYEKSRFMRRLLWSAATNSRLAWAVLRNPKSYRAELQFTGAPPFFLYFAVVLKLLRRMRLIYRITDFYPETIIAHLGRRPLSLGVLARLTWWLRRRVDRFEALGEDQKKILLGGGIAPERITVERDGPPVAISGRETPAAKPPALAGCRVLLYSGNYGIAHEVETVVQGLALHRRDGTGQFGLWLNASGQNADAVERRLTALGVPLARTPMVALPELPALLAAADAHLITLRPEFAGIVLPSKVYGCIRSGRPILFVGPESSDVHLLCARGAQRYVRVAPGDAAGFARALDALGG